MAAKQIDVRKILAERVASMDEQLGKLKAGSDEFSKTASSLGTIARSYAEVEKVINQAEDEKEKREEQKRMNDEELKYKETQQKIEAARFTAEKEFRRNQNRITMTDVFLNAISRTGSQLLYLGAWKHSHWAEYQLSDGASTQVPRSVENALRKLEPPKF